MRLASDLVIDELALDEAAFFFVSASSGVDGCRVNPRGPGRCGRQLETQGMPKKGAEVAAQNWKACSSGCSRLGLVRQVEELTWSRLQPATLT